MRENGCGCCCGVDSVAHAVGGDGDGGDYDVFVGDVVFDDDVIYGDANGDAVCDVGGDVEDDDGVCEGGGGGSGHCESDVGGDFIEALVS